eukprot:COSAG01_NODE_2256_length_8067_cov_5.797691_12_plen_88_part_00
MCVVRTLGAEAYMKDQNYDDAVTDLRAAFESAGDGLRTFPQGHPAETASIGRIRGLRPSHVCRWAFTSERDAACVRAGQARRRSSRS